MRALKILLVMLAAAAAEHATAADVVSQQTITLEGAQRVLAAAKHFAHEHGAPGGAIAIVDAGGHVVLVQRLDGTFVAGADISVGKARTAVAFKRPTRAIEEAINKGRTAMTPLASVTWFTPLQGGIPLVTNGEVVGGIGVSGASSAQQDEEIALAGAQALNAKRVAQEPGSGVTHIPRREVLSAYGKGITGETLVVSDAFRVNASRRDGPGQAEIHMHETDIFYVLEGSATVVTGGELVDGATVEEHEIRGTSIRGGVEHSLAPGDVLTIQRGVPHWFKAVTTPFRYFVVKSIEGA